MIAAAAEGKRRDSTRTDRSSPLRGTIDGLCIVLAAGDSDPSGRTVDL